MASAGKIAGFAVMCTTKEPYETTPENEMEGVYATYEEARLQASRCFIRHSLGQPFDYCTENEFMDDFSSYADKGQSLRVWVSRLDGAEGAPTSLSTYRTGTPRKLSGFAVMRAVMDQAEEQPTLEIRGLFARIEDARREVKLDLIREFGKEFFDEYAEVRGGSEVTAQGPKYETYLVFVQQLDGDPPAPRSTTNPSPSNPAETSSTSLPTPKTVYTILHHEQLRSTDPLIPRITKTRCLDEAYESLLEANQAAREYVIRAVLFADEPEGVSQSESAEAEWLDGFVIANGEEENRYSEEFPYSICIAGTGTEVEEITIEVKPLDFVPPRRQLQRNAVSVASGFPAHDIATATRSSEESGPPSNKRRRTDEAEGRVGFY
jgi:hypothetical protein